MSPDEEAGILRKAIITFQDNFNTYIKEMNSDLWDRALDYAKTYEDEEETQ